MLMMLMKYEIVVETGRKDLIEEQIVENFVVNDVKRAEISLR